VRLALLASRTLHACERETSCPPWYLSNLTGACEVAAIVEAAIETAELNRRDPQVYLAEVLARIADHPPGASPHCCPGTGGRNDACPCGSGRKYKKCCGAGTGPLHRPTSIPNIRDNQLTLT
jgi:hypothetical protein